MEIISVDLSMTMTAAVPNPDCASFNESKSILQSENYFKTGEFGAEVWERGLGEVNSDSFRRHTVLFRRDFLGGQGRRHRRGLSQGDYPIHL